MGIVVVAALAANAEAGARLPCDHGDPSANQIGRQRRQSIILAVRPTVFDRHALALDIASVFEAWMKCVQPGCVNPSGDLAVEEPDHRHPLVLLRALFKRPRGRRAAEERDELAPLHVRAPPGSADHRDGITFGRWRERHAVLRRERPRAVLPCKPNWA